MWPFKKRIVYTEEELQKCLSIITKDILQEAISVTLEVKTAKEAVKRIRGLMRKYESKI